MLRRGVPVPDQATLEALFSDIAGLPAIGLAVSGGPDSLGLMAMVRAWRDGRPTGPDVHVYTLDHGLRPEAAAEAAFVRDTAVEMKFAATVLRWDGPRPATGVQAAARTARYRLIGKAMAGDGVPVLLTAHHREDQAETVLMRLAHGSGISGLAGMARWADLEGVRVHRPLLGVAGATVRGFATRAGLTPVADPSNADERYERVRWRRAMPGLEALGLDAEGLARFARRMARADAALEQAARDAFASLVTVDHFGVIAIRRQALAEMPTEVGLRVLGRMLLAAGGAAQPKLHRLERLFDAANDEPFTGRNLSGSCIARDGERLIVYREAARIAPDPLTVAPGQSALWDRRFTITNGTDGPVKISPALDVTRKAAERFLGDRIEAPMAAVRAAPMLIEGRHELSGLGSYCRIAGVAISHAWPGGR